VRLDRCKTRAVSATYKGNEDLLVSAQSLMIPCRFEVKLQERGSASHQRAQTSASALTGGMVSRLIDR
jgi:hypothetical protein